MPVLTAPYLLVRGVVAISDAHDKRQQQWDNPRVVAACNDVFAWELLGLVLLSQLCEAHAEDRPDFLGTEDAWLAWIARAENRDTYRHARHAFARTLQADVGVLQQVRLTLSHPLEVDKALLWLTERFKRDVRSRHSSPFPSSVYRGPAHLPIPADPCSPGRTPRRSTLPDSGAQSSSLSTDPCSPVAQTSASSHSLSHLTHYATRGGTDSLGQASSRCFPQDRRLASAQGF